MTLRAIAIPPKSGQTAKGVFVGLHGWGANAQDLASLGEFLDLPDFYMIFPDAPFPHPNAPGGRMWYNFPENFSFRNDAGFRDRSDVSESRQQLTDWLKSLHDTTGVPLSQTYLAGFSQGGAMTLDVGTQLPLAALMSLSGYLHAPLEKGTQPIPPVLMVHGLQDTVVPIEAAQQARDRLTDLNAAIDYHELEMGHEIRPIVLELIQSFMDL